MTTNIFEAFDEQSQTLLQGLKPINLDGLKSDFFNKNNFDQNSGFVNSPFGQYWDINIHEWAKPYFGNAKILDKANIKIADKSLKVSHNQADSYNLLVKDNTSKYTFVVYADPDGEKVLEMYNNPENIPDPKKPFEVLLFIETDDGKFDFGKIVRVKFGASVIDDLIYKFSEELPWNDNDPEDIAKKFITSAWETNINRSFNQAKNEVKSDDGAFNDLLIKAIKYEYDNKKFDDFSWFITILKGAEYLGFNMPNWCFSLGGWFRERKYLEDKYWNGDLSEKEYTPAFMPNYLFYDEKEDRSRAFKDSFNETYNYLIERVGESLPNEDYLSQRIKSLLLFKISECKIITDEFIDDFLSVVNIPDGYFQTFIKHYHAYTLGLYNGIMELLASICDLTALVILICRDELGFRMTDLLLEKFENFTNDLFDNTIKTLKKIGYKTIEIFIDFAKWYNAFLDYDGKSYKILKEIGELVPDILTFVIPVLKGSKVAKVGKVGSEVVEKNVIKELSEAEAKQMTKAAKEAIEKGTAREAAREGAELIEEKIIEKSTTQLDEVVVESKKVVDDTKDITFKKPSKIITGKYSKRVFDINNCGGKILNLSWKNVNIDKKGIEIVKKHLSRLEYDEWNVRMIERLEKIINKKIPITDFDKRFYTHELREFERYKNLGYENSHFKNIPDEVWDNAHAATLEDYKLYEKIIFEDKEVYSLFHPEVQF